MNKAITEPFNVQKGARLPCKMHLSRASFMFLFHGNSLQKVKDRAPTVHAWKVIGRHIKDEFEMRGCAPKRSISSFS